MARLIQRLTTSIKTSLAFILLYAPAWASIPIKNTPIPGGIAVVNFHSESANPKAFYNQVPLFVAKNASNPTRHRYCPSLDRTKRLQIHKSFRSYLLQTHMPGFGLNLQNFGAPSLRLPKARD